MKGVRVEYSPGELAWIEAHKALPRKARHAAFCGRWGRKDVSEANLTGLCKRKRWLTGRPGTFAPGHVPANKGKTMPWHPNSAANRFRQGHVPHNAKHLGHERLTGDGYVEVSISERNPYTGYDRRYVQKHRYLWEQANGPVPEGMRLKCLDGNRTNTDPANWAAIPTALAPRLNGRFGRGYDTAPADLKPVIMTIARLEHRARERKREGEKA